jgi:hypothetical protein
MGCCWLLRSSAVLWCCVLLLVVWDNLIVGWASADAAWVYCCYRGLGILLLLQNEDAGILLLRCAVANVNTSGKASAQIPHPPWEMIHPPGGDNAVCM